MYSRLLGLPLRLVMAPVVDVLSRASDKVAGPRLLFDCSSLAIAPATKPGALFELVVILQGATTAWCQLRTPAARRDACGMLCACGGGPEGYQPAWQCLR